MWKLISLDFRNARRVPTLVEMQLARDDPSFLFDLLGAFEGGALGAPAPVYTIALSLCIVKWAMLAAFIGVTTNTVYVTVYTYLGFGVF